MSNVRPSAEVQICSFLISTDHIDQDSLVPRLEDIDEVDLSEVQWVLIVEKEASYPNVFAPHEGLPQKNYRQSFAD